MNQSSDNPLLTLIDAEIATREGMTREKLAKSSGLSRDIFRKLEERGSSGTLKLDSLRKIAAQLGMDVNRLIAAATQAPEPKRTGPMIGELRVAHTPPMPSSNVRDIPILGTAAGSIIGAFQISSDAIGYVARPSGLVGARDIYCVYVENESMRPMYAPGTLVFVHPHKPLQVGDAMIVQLKDGEDGDLQAFIKIFKGRTADDIIAEQYNPVATIRYKRTSVVSLHKVLTMNELFGA